MECGKRIPVFFYALKILDDLSSRECHHILEAMYLHAWFVSKHLSLYSSLGVHTIAEAVGLVFAGETFRASEEGKKWLKTGLKLLNDEARHQILDDGGPAEQSFHYFRYILDLYWLTVSFIERNNLSDCTYIRQRLTLGENFLTAFTNSDGKIISIGDSDDSFAIAPTMYPKRSNPGSKRRRIKTFSQAGYTVIVYDKDSSLIFDHGPLGMEPLYNHGHADALSIVLFKKEQPILVDPGTYHYNGVPEWRRYFKSTKAHNTVTVDGLDQAVQEDEFIWSKPYTS